MEQIQLTGVSKYYGAEVAVQHLDLTVAPGEFVTVLGPSGCGKTTTLRAVAGLEEPDQGEIRLGDRLVFSRREGIVVPPERRKLGLIFQSYALWPHMTVERNITLALKEQGLSASAIEQRLETALEMVQLVAYRKRYPSELSGGQQQRVAVARLIASRPSILLMDEPLSNLDAKLRTEMRGELKKLHRDLEATTVYVTHDQIEALTLSDRVVVMHQGLVVQEATPYDIYHYPRSLFVAEFIGDPGINRIAGTLRAQGGVPGIDCGDQWLPLERDVPSRTGEVVMTVRPEQVKVSTQAEEGWLEAVLDSVQPTGADTILSARSPLGDITLLQPGFVRMAVGDPVWVDFDRLALNFFDADTELNLQA